jgi:hypothetical protein
MSSDDKTPAVSNGSRPASSTDDVSKSTVPDEREELGVDDRLIGDDNELLEATRGRVKEREDSPGKTNNY